MLKVLHISLCLGVVTALLLVAGAVCALDHRQKGGGPRGFQLDIGGMEIIASINHISASGFPTTSMNPFRRTPIHRFSVRHDGSPFVFESKRPDGILRLTSFNMLYYLAEAETPAVLLPIDGFQLLSTGVSGMQVRSLEARPQPTPTMQWLDADDGQPSTEFRHGLGLHEPADLALQGGRWLLLNRSSVLDVKTLKHYPVRPWVPSSSGQRMAGLNGSTQAAILLSPDRKRYVLEGGGLADDGSGTFDRALLIIDIATGNAHGVEFPHVLQDKLPLGPLTGEWIETHFKWVATDSIYTLVPRI